jgi:hypothetical protein
MTKVGFEFAHRRDSFGGDLLVRYGNERGIHNRSDGNVTFRNRPLSDRC